MIKKKDQEYLINEALQRQPEYTELMSLKSELEELFKKACESLTDNEKQIIEKYPSFYRKQKNVRLNRILWTQIPSQYDILFNSPTPSCMISFPESGVDKDKNQIREGCREVVEEFRSKGEKYKELADKLQMYERALKNVLSSNISQVKVLCPNLYKLYENLKKNADSKE